jgi:hypothetical protein
MVWTDRIARTPAVSPVRLKEVADYTKQTPENWCVRLCWLQRILAAMGNAKYTRPSCPKPNCRGLPTSPPADSSLLEIAIEAGEPHQLEQIVVRLLLDL